MKVENLKKLNDYFPDWYEQKNEGGIFTQLDHLIDAPWLTLPSYLDLLYHSSRDMRYASPLLDVLANPPQPSGGIKIYANKYAEFVSKMFVPDWNRLWSALQLDYNAIEPYKQVKEGHDIVMGSHTTDDTGTVKNDNKRTTNGSNTTTNSGSDILATTHDNDSVVTQVSAWTETQTSTVTKSGSETTTSNEDVNTSYPETRDTATTTYGDGSTPLTEKTTMGGSERIAEKGGNVTSVWGFDSSDPVKAEKTIATGGEGTGSGSGDGSVSGDGHVTTTSYQDRENTVERSGKSEVVTERVFPNPSANKETKNTSADSTLSFTDRSDTTSTTIEHPEREETKTFQGTERNTTTFGKQVTETSDGGVTDDGTQTRNLQSKTSIDDTTTHDSTVTGNIGVFTSQTQLEQEYELRKKHFFDAVFADLDRMLTLSIWG